jgi:hypothetical protein
MSAWLHSMEKSKEQALLSMSQRLFGLSENGKWVPLEKETGLSHECQ